MKCVSGLIVLSLAVCVFSQKDHHWWQDRNTIVQLFEWKFSDIADECERFLQHKGYAGVQVSPVSENVIIHNRPWWERYQPISYKIITRSGNENDFRNMTKRCNAVGVRIYVDVVFNHMAAATNVPGVGGSTANPDAKLYPAVPYGPGDFHDSCSVWNYNDPNNVRNCDLVGLKDLNQGSDYVRGKIREFLNKLVSLGVAGFRVDAAKHMSPEDLRIIYQSLDNLNTMYGFPEGARPYIYQEVIDMGGEGVSSHEYVSIGDVTEFKYCNNIGRVFRGPEKLTYLENWGAGWGFLPNGDDALVFVDNHDNQRDGSSALTYKEAKKYKMATAFMLAHTYGTTRIMSSFFFDDKEAGPPADWSQNIISPKINPDDTCGNGWVCEHRWRQIYNMVGFKNAVRGTGITNWWSNGDQQIAFSRGNKGFIAFNGYGDLRRTFNTFLPPGIYCDVISGNLIGGKCTGKAVLVNNSGEAYVEILHDQEDGVFALHVNARL